MMNNIMGLEFGLASNKQASFSFKPGVSISSWLKIMVL